MELYCLGDSFTYGFGVLRKHCWTTLLETEIGIAVHNLGMNGDTTGGMLVRLYTEILPKLGKDSSVFLMGGCNDVFFSGSDHGARANMAAMLNLLVSKSIKTYVGIPFCPSPQLNHSDWDSIVDFRCAAEILVIYNSWLSSFCHVYGIPTVDFNCLPFSDAEMYLLEDNIHPNIQGHRLVADAMVRLILGSPDEETEQK